MIVCPKCNTEIGPYATLCYRCQAQLHVFAVFVDGGRNVYALVCGSFSTIEEAARQSMQIPGEHRVIVRYSGTIPERGNMAVEEMFQLLPDGNIHQVHGIHILVVAGRVHIPPFTMDVAS